MAIYQMLIYYYTQRSFQAPEFELNDFIPKLRNDLKSDVRLCF